MLSFVVPLKTNVKISMIFLKKKNIVEMHVSLDTMDARGRRQVKTSPIRSRIQNK